MPTVSGFALGNAGQAFAATVDVSVDLGSNSDRWILVMCITQASGTSSGYLNDCVIDPSGTPVTISPEADQDLNTVYGVPGRVTWYRLAGASVPTGVKTIRVTADDANTKPRVLVLYGYGGTSIAASPTGTTAGASNSYTSGAVTSSTNDTVVALGYISTGTPNSSTLTGTSSTTVLNGSPGSYEALFGAWKAGASSVTLTGTSSGGSFTAGWMQRAWNVVGAASTPVITGPSGAAGAGSSTANIAENASTGPTFSTDIALGGGYPTITGAQAANWTLTALSSTSWRADPVTPFNFEAGGLVNPQAIVFNASASVSQSCSVTVTNVNETPTFSGTVSVPTLTQGSAMTPVNAGALFSDPDSGDTGTYSAVGVWPAGVTVDSSTGIISGTPSAAATYANLRVRRTDASSLTADSNLFTITVAASGGVTFSGTVPAQSGTVGTAFSLALTSYFSGTGTYAVQAGTLPTGLSLDTSTGAITGTPSAAGTFSGVVIRKTAASGSPATADTNAFTITVAAAPSFATSVSITLTTDGTTPAANLTGLKVAVFDQATPDLWAGHAPIYVTAAATTNGSGVLTCSIAGLTGLAPGALAGLVVSSSDGTLTQGAAQKGYVGPALVS